MASTRPPGTNRNEGDAIPASRRFVHRRRHASRDLLLRGIAGVNPLDPRVARPDRNVGPTTEKSLRAMKPSLEQMDSVRLLVDAGAGSRIDFAEIRGGPGLVEVEVGSGKGEFLVEAARRNPRTLFIGVEISRKYALKTAARIVRSSVTNARIVWMDSLVFLDRLVPPASLQAIHVYFPDPWPKRRHHRRRVFNPAFVRAVTLALKPGGSLFFLTDDSGIYDHAVRLTTIAGGLVPKPFVVSSPDRPRTGYETKWLSQNRVILGERWVRRGR
jgi:tRNA (guanine-N7-)-methyltransferase